MRSSRRVTVAAWRRPSGSPCRASTRASSTALAFLSFARHCVLKKADGLSDEQLRRVLTGSGTSVLGLVQHLAEAERYWFGHHLAGAAWDPGREHGMTVPASRAAADVLRDYRAAIQDSDRAIRVAGDPEARFCASPAPAGLAASGLSRLGVGEVHDAALERRGVDELQRQLSAGGAEQPLAGAGHQGEDEQVQLVQQPLAQQRAD
jgi:hypothetical protein